MKNQNKEEIQEELLLRDRLLELVTFKIYQFLGEINDGLVATVDNKLANDILISALAINLGHVIGQLTPADQRRYSSIAKQLIKEHTLIGTIEKDRYVHGDIGHG